MTGPAYPAALTAAKRVEPHFRKHVEAERLADRRPLAHIPDVATMEAIIDAGFWASLRREEGYTPKISLAFVPPADSEQPLLLERPLPVVPDALARLAPAVERAGIHLGIWHDGGHLSVWGTTRVIPNYSFVLEVVQPGLLVIKHRRGRDASKFVNVAVLEGNRIKVLDPEAARLTDCPALVTSLLGNDPPATRASSSINPLVELAVSMRNHGRGGALLLVPANTDQWRESIVRPMDYNVSPALSEISDLMKAPLGDRADRGWQEALHRAVDAVAGLTAVDGATVVSDAYELLAFGVKIARRQGSPQVKRVLITEPVQGVDSVIAHPSVVGGTRHFSAAQFAHDQRNSVALVASQDGRFTIFAWSHTEDMVHAHRVEALLL